MENNKGIFIAEQMASTKLVSKLRNGQQATDIENGAIVKLGELVAGEQDLYNTVAPEAATDTIYLVDGVELDARESLAVGLDNFVNKANNPFRLRRPVSGDRFSISKSMVSGAVAPGAILEASTTNKLTVNDAPTAGAVQFEVVEEWVFSGRAIDMVRLEVK